MRSSSEYLTSLEQVPLFGGMSKKQLRAVASRLTPVDVAAGRELTHQGGGGREFFVVLEGTAVVTKDGRPHSRVEPGGFFGELALLVPHVRMATVTAETDMVIGVMTRQDFIGLVQDVPSVAVHVMEQLAMLVLDVYPLHHTELVDVDLTEPTPAPPPR